MVKGLLVHVAIDSSARAHARNLGVVGPVFDDLRFEYIPLNNTYGIEDKTYSDAPARNQEYGRTLGDFLPAELRRLPIHFDPDFNNFTYGQHGGVYPRVKSLEKLREGNFIFFVASLAPYDPGIYKGDITSLKSYQVGMKNKYVIGFFKVKGVAEAFVFKFSPRLALTLLNIVSFQESGEMPLEMGEMRQELETLEGYGYICKEGGDYRLTGEADNKIRSGEDLLVAIDEMWPEDDDAKRWLFENGCVDINIISGEVSEDELKQNHHYKRLRQLDIDWFSLIAGDSGESALLDRAIPLTEKYENGTFRLNEIGRQIRKRNTDTLRGTRWVDKEGVNLLMDEILKMNPQALKGCA